MSSNLYWRPEVKDSDYLGYDLKFALRNRFGFVSTEAVPYYIGDSDIQWLLGIIDAEGQGTSEAKELMKLVQKHKSVLVWESM